MDLNEYENRLYGNMKDDNVVHAVIKMNESEFRSLISGESEAELEMNKHDPATVFYDFDFMKHLVNIMYVWVCEHKHIKPKFQLIEFSRCNKTQGYTLKLRDLNTRKKYILTSIGGKLKLNIPSENPENYDLRMVFQYSPDGVLIWETADIRSNRDDIARGIYRG